MDLFESLIWSKTMTRRLFYGLPVVDVKPKNQAIIHRERYSFKLKEGMFIETTKGIKLITDIRPDGHFEVEGYHENNQTLHKNKGSKELIHHSDINDPYDHFISAKEERKELIKTIT